MKLQGIGSAWLVLNFMFCVGAPLTRAQTIWTAGTGDWFTATNWSDGVPGSQAAQINNGGTPQITSSGAAGGVTLGAAAEDSGNLVVSGSGTLDGELTVGESGIGSFSVTGGGEVTTGRFVLGSGAGSTGTATVSGAGSTWSNRVICFVGYSGTGVLNIIGGGQVSDSDASVGESSGSDGTVTIDGAGSVWQHPGTVTVAGNGTGTVNVTNGGKLVTWGSGGSFGSTIGRNPGSDGLVTVSGFGSAWTNDASLSVGSGFAGTAGALSVSDGGTVSNAYAVVGGMGGHGAVVIDGAGSTWTNNGALSIAPYANDGGAGTLTIRQGGKVSSFSGSVGPGAGAVNIDGAGSAWTNSGSVTLGTESPMAPANILRITRGGFFSATGTTVYKAGIVQLGIGTLKGPLTFRGGSIETLRNITLARNFVIGAGGVRVRTAGYHSTFSGNISGPGGLTKAAGQPAGSLTLTGSNSYGGPTTVNGGALIVNGSITSPSTVNDRGTLSGRGTVGAVTVKSGGSVAPGKGVGTLSVQGNYKQASGGRLRIDLGGYKAGTQFDRLVVTGAAEIAGSLHVRLVDGFRPRQGDTFKIITSGSQTGNFSAIKTEGFTVRSDRGPRGITLTVLTVASL